jgi:hypothetical protein
MYIGYMYYLLIVGDIFMSDVIKEESGVFRSTLKRNNKQIREDRAENIIEDTQLVYKRSIEDLTLEINKLRREQDSMLDLSPTNATSLVHANDFDEKSFVEKDIIISLKIRNAQIKLDLAKVRYNYLFGGE